jgi:hypothetical protein
MINGPLIALALFGFLVLIWGATRVNIACPTLLGGGAFALVWGFTFSIAPLMILGFLACGAGVFVHEHRVWERKARASEDLDSEARTREVAAEGLAGHETVAR